MSLGDVQMQPMPPPYMAGTPRQPQRMASKESVTSEGSLYLEPTPRNSAQLPSNRGSLPGEHDSGVVDVDGLHPDFLSESSTLPPKHSSTSPRSSLDPSPQKGASPYLPQGQGRFPGHMMKRPDSLAGRGHEYEELPHSRYTNPARPYYNESESGSGDRPPPPPINKLSQLNNNSASGSRGSLENLCDAVASADKAPNTHRRRENPLYDSVEHEEAQDYKSKRRKSDWCQCLCLTQIVIGLIALVALLLAVLSLIGATDDDEPKTAAVIQPLPNNSDLQKALERLEQLEANYAALLKKYSDLQSAHSQDIHVIRQNMSTYSQRVVGAETEIQGLQTSLDTGLSNLNTELLAKIDDVSKMQGPPGVGNLTACQKVSKRVSSPIGWDTTSTPLIPENQAEADTYVIMGVECTTEGGSLSRLISETATWGTGWQYKCECSGQDANVGGTNRKCEVVYWHCPRLS